MIENSSQSSNSILLNNVLFHLSFIWSVNGRHPLYSASEIDLWKYSKILCFWYDLMLGKQAYEQI